MENDPKELKTQHVAPLLGEEARIEYYDTSLDWVPAGKLRSAAQAVYPYAHKVFRGLDWLGGKFAVGLGITNSRFQYAVDEYNRRERRMKEREAQERAKQDAIKRQQGMVDEEDSRMPYVPPVSLIFTSPSAASPPSTSAASAAPAETGAAAAAASSSSSSSSSSSAVQVESLKQKNNQNATEQAAKKTHSTSAVAAAGDDDEGDEEKKPVESVTKLDQEMKNL